MLDLVYCADPRLKEVSKEVTVFDRELKNFVDEMFTLLEATGGVGLAAIQVGRPIRLFITNTGEEGERLVFINPTITRTSDDNEPYNEGCLSIPGVYRDIRRPTFVQVQAYDVNGKRFNLNADGLLARVIQHENDHLDGKLFISRLGEEGEREAVKEFKKKNKRLLSRLAKERQEQK